MTFDLYICVPVYLYTEVKVQSHRRKSCYSGRCDLEWELSSLWWA